MPPPNAAVPWTPTRIILEVVAAAAMAVWLVSFAGVWDAIRAQPAASSKEAILLFPVIGVLIYLLTSWCVRIPHAHNYMVPVSPENARDLHRTSVSLVTWIKAETIVLLGLIHWMQVGAAIGRPGGAGPVLVPLTILATVITVAVHVYRLQRPKVSA